jgi:Fe-coproporphyrin III synthase
MIWNTTVPHSVRLLLTQQCNLKCKFCFINATEKVELKELTTEEWLRFFSRLKELLIFNLIISGGEIFLRNDLFILLGRLRENRIHRITLLTNGTLICDAHAVHLHRLKIKNILVSLDGMEERNDTVRGQGAFKNALQGIRRLIDVGLSPGVAFTPVKNNYKDLGPIIDLVAEMGVKLFRLNTLTPEGRCTELYPQLALDYPHQVEEVNRVIQFRERQYEDLKINCDIDMFYRLPRMYEESQRKSSQKRRIRNFKEGCGSASTCCTITSTGDVIPCEGFSEFVGGNILKDDLVPIWRESENFKKIRDLGKISLADVPYCRNCKYNVLCDGGCRSVAYRFYDDMHAPTGLCPHWKQLER